MANRYSTLEGVTFDIVVLHGDYLAEADRYFDVMLAYGFTEDQGRRPDEDCNGIFAKDASGRTLGMAVIHDIEGEGHAWLWLLYVEPSARRMGLGRALLDLSIAGAWKLWEKPIGLGTQGFNRPMQRLADRSGFKVEAIYYAPKLWDAPEVRQEASHG
ncbi:MAG: GNAT family N-acetyltransferase [Rhizobiaceae bacterium]|nr:GNAT family N-acetyltransferase [Rhizobiaceae bacterium]